MEICIGIVSSIVTKAGEYMLSPIKNHVKYISNHEKNVQILEKLVERLANARERVQHSVDEAKRNGEEIEQDVNEWLSTVDEKIGKGVKKVMQDEEKAKKNCFIGLCPNPWTRYKHSLRAEEETDAVTELLERGKFERVSYRSAPQVGFMVASVKGFEEFESRTLVLNGIMEALKEDGVSVIGVYGMGGIGKTTLVKQVARKVKGELFDSVVIATVTQTLDVKEIQNQIAELLGLKFEEQSMVRRADRLRDRLSKENKILVVLDDIWAKLDIGEVGIPFGDEHKGCKILLTSRERNVLSNGMDTQKNFAVEVLNDKEAWDLFKKMAGDCVETSDLQPTAMEVAKKCAGLPIAIATVASALRNKSKFEWKNALRELKTPSSSNLTGITAAYSAIEWSYNYLESEEVKMTFLLCSLIGHNGSVEDLVRYTLGLGLFGGVNTMEDSRNKVLTVVANLKASCLLLDSYSDKRFDIHDVVWDAALTIALRDGHMLVLRDHVPKEWSDKEKMHNWAVISIRSPHIIAELPKEMECSGLSFFHMAHNGSVKIPSCFFRQTKSLKVLDLFGMQFLSLRESISHLTDLRTLCLRKCALEDITIIGELKNLEILSLAESDIKALPLEIAQLSRLKLLDLSRCSKLKVIPPNVLSSFSKLEELYMERSFAEWEDEGVVGNERRNASLDELNNLPLLTTLYAHIPNAEMILKHRFVETLDRYRISIGDDKGHYWSENHEFSRTLSFKLDKNMYLDNGVKMLLMKTEDLYLEGLEGIKNVLVELNNGEGFPYLKRLNVKNGMQVQYITKEKIEFSELRSITLNDLPQLISFCSQDERCSTSSEPLPLFNKQFVFPNLESLQLSFINAKCIWDNQTCDWVSKLTKLIIKDCPNLEHLLSPSMARNLMHLQQFEIENCESLREIIFTEEIEEEKKDVISFPRLKNLKIRNLQNLTIFCSGNYNIEFPLLKELLIDNCPNLKEFISQTSDQSGKHALFNEKVALPNLEKMTISSLRNVKMIFHNELLAPGSFCNLEKLQVTNCDSLEQIFELGGLNAKELHAVDSQQRPKLKHVWNKDPQEIPTFQNLRNVDVWSCNSLKNVFPASIAKDLPKLEDLSIKFCGVEEIVSVGEVVEQPVRFKFPQVSSLDVRDLKKLKCFYEGQHTIVWPMLKKLTTDYSTLPKILALECIGIQETNGNNQPESTIGQSVSLDGNNQPESTIGQSVFSVKEAALPSLERMKISCLRNVKMIFHNELLAPGSFCKLEKIKVTSCNELLTISSPTTCWIFRCLENLQVSNCDSLEQIFEFGGLNTKELHAVNPQEIPAFQNLRKVHVSFCKSLKNVFPASIAKDLPKLEDLSIDFCGVEEIVSVEDGVEQPVRFKFPQVSSLHLRDLKKLKCFYEGQHTIVWPKLKKLMTDYSTLPKILALECLGIQETNGNNQPESTIGQSVFSVKEVIPKLEELGLRNLGDVDQFPPDLFHCIKVFKVFGSHGRSSIFLFLQKLYSLKSLELYGFDFKDEVPCKADAGPPTRIRNLYLSRSKNLKHVLKKDSELDLILSNLQTLSVSSCDDLINIEPLSLSFQNLTTLEVVFCDMMTYLVTPSVVQNLVQLTTLSVSQCSEMTEIVTNEGDGATYHQTLVLGKLKCLQLSLLKSLTSFCPGDYTFSFPYLEELVVDRCPRLEIFSQGVLSTPKLQCVKDLSYDGEHWAGDVNTTIEQMYIEEVGSDDLYELKFSDTFPDLMEIWNRRNPREILGFKGVREMEFCNCSSLKYIFTPSMLLSIEDLNWLKVKECNSMEEVINEEEEDATRHILTYPPLLVIEIESCPNLTRFYMGSRALEFPDLNSIEIADCPKMNAFCSSIEKGIGQLDAPFFSNQVLCPSLWFLRIDGMRDCTKIWPYQLAVNSCCKLQFLSIQNCDSLEEIIEPQGLVAYESDAVTATTKFAFPELIYLGLHKLPELKRFCSTMHTTQWPSLKRMEVTECPKVLIFAPCGETQTETRGGISNKNALFCVNEDTFPVLEELTLKQNDMMNGICQGQLSLECFNELKSLNLQCFPQTSTTLPYRFIESLPELKSLNLQCFPETSTALPYRLIQSLPNLEKLIINNASNCQILQSEVLGNEERHTPPLTQIKELWLSKLPELTLKTLEPSLQSFKNLTTLEVSSCNGFINLMACTTVKSLMVLEKMSITDCEMIEEIITCEGEEIQGSIVFPKLKYLQLSCLPNLASFSVGDRVFEFPVLQTVIVKKCKNMRSFCQGDLSNVPRFHLTRDDEDRLWWEGDINATIKHMFDEENVQNSDVSEVPHRLLELE